MDLTEKIQKKFKLAEKIEYLIGTFYAGPYRRFFSSLLYFNGRYSGGNLIKLDPG